MFNIVDDYMKNVGSTALFCPVILHSKDFGRIYTVRGNVPKMTKLCLNQTRL